MKEAQQDPCSHCEEMMQPYLDHILTRRSVSRRSCISTSADWCRRRYRFEESLRIYVRQAVSEPMSAALKQKLSNLRVPLN